MNKEGVFKEIEDFVKQKFTNETTRFIGVAVSPYSKHIVVEHQVKNKILKPKPEDKNKKYKWSNVLMHFSTWEFEGLEELRIKYCEAKKLENAGL